MSIITKTIEYAYETYPNSIAGGVTYDFSGLTIVIPETGYTIENAFSQVTCYDSVTVATSMTGWQAGVSFDGVNFYYPPNSATTNSTQITNSGLGMSFVTLTDLTREFRNNMTTSSSTLSIRTLFNNSSTNGRTCKIFITYSFENSGISRTIKTAKIPIGGARVNLVGTVALGGWGNIPAFDTIFPEASKEYHDIFFEVFGNDRSAATTDFNMTLGVAGDSTSSRFTIEAQAQGGRYYYDIWKYPTLSAATSGSNINTLTAASSLADRFGDTAAIMTVTYSYDEQSTSRVLNSLQASIFDSYAIHVHGTTTSDAETSVREIIINEPGAITTRQSGFVVYCATQSGFNLFLRHPSQSYLQYTVSVPTINAGQHSRLHRIDSGFTAATSTFSLTNGLNKVVAQNYTDSVALNGSGISGILYLNYESGKSEYGSNAHNRTVCFLMTGTSAVGTKFTYNFNYNKFEETFINDAFLNTVGMSTYFTQGFEVYSKYQTTGTSENYGFAGWQNTAKLFQKSDNEMGVFNYITRIKDIKRFPVTYEPESIDISVNRTFKNQYLTTSHNSTVGCFNIFDIPNVLSGTVSNYSGSGENIDVKIYDYNNNEYLLSATTTSGGEFSTNWYDNTRDVYVVAYENSERKGVSSINDTNSGTTSFDIDLQSGGGGGETFYGFC